MDPGEPESHGGSQEGEEASVQAAAALGQPIACVSVSSLDPSPTVSPDKQQPGTPRLTSAPLNAAPHGPMHLPALRLAPQQHLDRSSHSDGTEASSAMSTRAQFSQSFSVGMCSSVPQIRTLHSTTTASRAPALRVFNSAPPPQKAGSPAVRTQNRIMQAINDRPDFWSNLPRISKLYLIMSVINTALILSLVILDFVSFHQVCSCGETFILSFDRISECPVALRGSCRWEPQELYLALLVLTVLAHYNGFVYTALSAENSYALMTSVLLGIVLLAIVVFFTAQEHASGGRPVMTISSVVVGSTAAAIQVALLGLAAASYGQMGWRTYSQIAADVREKDASKHRELYVKVNKFTTYVKLDFMMSMLLLYVSLIAWIAYPFWESDSMTLGVNFLLWPILGFIINITWLVMCWLSVRKEWNTVGRWTSHLMPITLIYQLFALAAVCITLGLAEYELEDKGISDDQRHVIVKSGTGTTVNVGISVAFLMLARYLAWKSMRSILARFYLSPTSVLREMERRVSSEKLQGGSVTGRVGSNVQGSFVTSSAPLGAMRSVSGPKAAQHEVHPDVLPLIKGAWIGKPSPSNQRKQRFFQLSQDGTTLRWAWSKYILVLYVDDVEENEDDLELTLCMATEPDLLLRFKDKELYRIWARGFRVLLAMLLGPEGIAASLHNLDHVDGMFHAKPSPNAKDKPPSSSHNLLKQALEEQHRRETESVRSQIAKVVNTVINPSQRHSVADPNAVTLELAKTEARRSMDRQYSGEAAACQGSGKATNGSGAPASSSGSIDSIQHTGSGAVLDPIQEEARSDHSSGSGLKKAFSIAMGEQDRTRVGLQYPEPGGPLVDAPQPQAATAHVNSTDSSTVTPYGTPPVSTGILSSRGVLGMPHVEASQISPYMSVCDQLGLAGRVDDIEPDELQLGKFLGAGAEGAVYAAWYNESPVAVKKNCSVSEIQMHVMAGLHDNVVSARGISFQEKDSTLDLVIEYCPRGTLDTMIHFANKGSGPGWDALKVVLPMVRCIARGLLHLHKRSLPILHRDLKPGNIFVGHGLVMKIGDFGMSRYVMKNAQRRSGQSPGSRFHRTFTSGVVGTSVYSAPEVLAASSDDMDVEPETMLKADIYSFGVTLWEILTRKRPFEGLDHFEIQTAWLIHPDEMKLPPVKVDPGLSPQAARVIATLAELAEECMEFCPDDRPTAKQVVSRLKKATATTANV